jgi:hypothetical protein
VDRYGLVTNHTDIGFASIGVGGIHSSAHFMLEAYSHGTAYYRALYQTFKAKKRAEVARGVGEFTEMFLVTRDGASPVERKVIEALENIHKEDAKRLGDRVVEVEDELGRYFREAYPTPQSGIG